MIDRTLFGDIDLVQVAIDRLRMFEPIEFGYYGAFSGGKDSICIKELCRLAGVRVDWHYNLTTVDPPEVVNFIRLHHPDVERHRPKYSMWELIAKKRLPPTRVVRYCCQYLKEGRGTGNLDRGRTILTGVRWAESVRRRSRRMVETCQQNATKNYVHPIIDWTDDQVWTFIRSRNLPYPSIYDEGFKRVGCIGCPLAGSTGMLRDFARWPKYRAAYLRAFAKMIAERERLGLNHETEHFKTPESVMQWWLYGNRPTDPAQCGLFE